MEFNSFQQRLAAHCQHALEQVKDPSQLSLFALLDQIGIERGKVAEGTSDKAFKFGEHRKSHAPLNTAIFQNVPKGATPNYSRYYKPLHTICQNGTRTETPLGTAMVGYNGYTMFTDGIVEQILPEILAKSPHGTITHCPTSKIPEALGIAQKHFQLLSIYLHTEPRPLTTEILKAIASLHWYLSQATPFRRGSAACTEVLIQGCFQAFKFPVPLFKGLAKDGNGIVYMDLEALTRPEQEFVHRYQELYAQISGNPD